MAENHLLLDVLTISRLKKERFLLEMSEDDFRDKVVRPLFLRQNLKDGREFCGTTEKGKDAIFVAIDQLGKENVYVVQTKKGKLNLASKVIANIIVAITQVKTALETPIYFINPRQKKFPTKVFLCASGKINESAKQHIVDEIKDPRIEFMDSDDIIPLIDANYPELWYGIDRDIFPYFKKLKSNLESQSETLNIADVLPNNTSVGIVTEDMFVPLQIHRTILKHIKRRGMIIDEPKFEELPITGILSRKESLFVIFGDAGSGKSTSLKRLAYVAVEKSLKEYKNYKIPVLLRCFDLNANDKLTLIELCYQETNRLTQSTKQCFSVDDLSAGSVIVLLDGLDELADDETRAKVINKIIDFNRCYPLCKVIITSRNYSTIRALPQLRLFENYFLSAISFRQAEMIINRIQKAKKVPKELSEEILRRLQDIHGMVLNPLLVTVFAATTDYSRKDIPANITELFKKFTELMLGRWDANKGLSQQYHAPLKDFVLKKVAYEMHRRESISLEINEFKNIVQSELASRGQTPTNIDQFYEEILYRSGLLKIIDDNVEFKHLLLQEFYAGRGIPSHDILESYITKEWWQRAIVFYFGENPGDNVGLESTIGTIKNKQTAEVLCAAVTIGLSLQAAYLIKTKEKVNSLMWVIETLSVLKEPFLEDFNKNRETPILKFSFYYLFGRDAVACSILEEYADEILKRFDESHDLISHQEGLRFWVIIGLIESGSLEKAEKLIKMFHPNDARLLLAIHIGCFIIKHLRVSTKEQKKISERISDALADRVEPFRKIMIEELKSELIELRSGSVRAITLPNS